MSSSKVVKDWFDQLEQAVEHDARRAGLLEHGASVGTAREFLVKRVLQTILPPAVHIGTGMVMDARGEKRSKQIDIVLFDPRTPVFEIHKGFGLYPIEGVVATIEVKSSLENSADLEIALENCRSVLTLSARILPDAETVTDAAREVAQREGRSPEEALKTVQFDLKPATYVFSFRAALSLSKFRETIESWYESQKFPADCQGACPHLPRIVVGGENIAVLRDAWIDLDPTDERQAQQARRELGSNARVLMGCMKTEHRLGWFACHLLHTIARRMVLPHGSMSIRYSTDAYLPIQHYADEIRDREDREKVEIIWWTGGAAR